jgi:hypothetical protein
MGDIANASSNCGIETPVDGNLGCDEMT